MNRVIDSLNGTICVFFVFLFFCCFVDYSKVWAGPPPMPLEAQIDMADHVVIGKITKIEIDQDDKNRSDYERWGWATINITETLKGATQKDIRVHVATWISPKHGGASPPRVYKAGDSGIWLVYGNNISHFYGRLEQEQKGAVRTILNSFGQRKWSAEVNGLATWAGTVKPDYHRNYVIIFAIKNLSNHDIYYPFGPFVMQAILNNEDGKESTVNLYASKYRQLTQRDYDKKSVSCQKISSGETKYLHPDYSFIDLGWKYELAPGKYKVRIIYENDKPGETTLGAAEKINVSAWQGKIETLPVDVIVGRPDSKDTTQTTTQQSK